MVKSKVLTALTIFFAALAVISTLTLARAAYAAGDDVFMDEGDGDFDAPPAVTDTPAAKPEKKSVQVEKAPEPRAAVPEVQDSSIPVLTDDSSVSSTPALTEDPSAPVDAQPKEKKAKKKKSGKKASKTASGTASSGAGSFKVTKEACPMMREPASTSETMLTVKASKKIWVEEAGEGWVKGFNKAGEPGYISKDCLQ